MASVSNARKQHDHSRLDVAVARVQAIWNAIPGWLLILTSLAVHAVAAVIIIQRGFLEYNADGYTRIMRGHEWLAAPRWEVSVWLPLQTWLFGAGLFIHDSLAVTPRAISFTLSLATIAGLYLIGQALGGKLAGSVAALLGAVFPWLVWFGVSGMSEALFHATLVLGVFGFVRWLPEREPRWLTIAALGLLLSTMVRYEGWFYAAVFWALVVGLMWFRDRRLSWPTLALATLPLAFPAIWMQQYWQRYGDPFGFARETADIKAELDAGNASATLWDKLSAYPEATLRLAPWLGLLCALAAIYALYRRVAWWPLIALIAGQGILLVGVSAGFSNLGPGAERYLLSNFILLFPVLGASLTLVPKPPLRLAAIGFTIIIGITIVRTMIAPPTWYPDADARDVARYAGDALSAVDGANDRVPVLLPHAPAEGFNASYAMRILSGHPDDFLITSDPALFQAWLDTTNPPLWIIDTDAGVAAPTGWQTDEVGRFIVGTVERLNE